MDVTAVAILVAVVSAAASVVPALVKYAITRRLTRSGLSPEVLKSLPAILQAVDRPRAVDRLGKALRRKLPDDGHI